MKMNDEIENINDEHNKIIEDKKSSDVDPNLNISHELPQEIEEKERQAKEEKAKVLVETIKSDLKSYLDSQIQQIPALINQNIQSAFQQIAPQLNQQAAPPQGGSGEADKMAMLAQLAPVLQGLFGKGEQAPSQSNVIMDMIVQSYMKKMQMEIDSQFMQTYNRPVNPPQWQEPSAPNQNQNPRFE